MVAPPRLLPPCALASVPAEGVTVAHNQQTPKEAAMDPVPDLSRSVRGKVALVTGAASGMGRATAHVFAREGAKVAVTDRRLEDAETVAAEIRAEGGEARAWSLDVGDAA